MPAKLVCPKPVRSSVVTRLSPKSATFTTPYRAATCVIKSNPRLCCTVSKDGTLKSNLVPYTL